LILFDKKNPENASKIAARDVGSVRLAFVAAGKSIGTWQAKPLPGSKIIRHS
jgi:hypothetical protein